MNKLLGTTFFHDTFLLTILRDMDGICKVNLPWQACPEYTAAPEDGLLKDAVYQLGQYFSGRFKEISLPLSIRGSAHALSVYTALLKNVPYGKTLTYKQLASIAGGSSRSVGNALRINPLPILIPCHRIIRSDGGLGGYGGPEADHISFKRFLLELEQAIPVCPSGK